MAEKKKMHIGQCIKRLREEAKMQQKDLAKKVGVTVASLSGYENDISEPSLYTTTKLAEALGVSIDYLVNGKDESVGKMIESKTGLSTEALRYLNRIAKYCDSKDIENPINQLLEKQDFQKGINELLCMIIILISDLKSTTETEEIGKLVHELNVAHVLNGGDINRYQGIFYEIARLHAEDSKRSIGKAIDKVRMEVWNNGEC